MITTTVSNVSPARWRVSQYASTAAIDGTPWSRWEGGDLGAVPTLSLPETTGEDVPPGILVEVTEIVPAGGAEVQVHGDLQRFEQMLLDQLASAGLPVAGVLVDLEEREQALTTLDRALRRLPVGERGRSYYVSKMIAAAAAGLFDAALN